MHRFSGTDSSVVMSNRPSAFGGSGVPSSGGGGSSYDEDAQTYFDALEAAFDTAGEDPPADYDDKKTAISDYFTNLKEDDNFTCQKAMYIPIWRVAGPNAINAVNPGTYNLTFNGTVTHNGGDYIYSDGTSGYASTGFYGCASTNAKFFEIGSSSAGCNALTTNSTNARYAYGWYSWFSLALRGHSTAATWYWWNGHNSVTTDGTKNGLWTSNSITPDGSDTNKGQMWRNGVSLGTSTSGSGTGSNTNSNGAEMALMARAHSNSVWTGGFTVVHFNFWHFGTQITDMDDFNTDTATFLAAI